MNEAHPDKAFESSLPTGGLLYGVLSRAGLVKPGVSALLMQVLITWLITWFPLLILSVLERQALGKGVQVPFLYDFAVHVRFLFVAPLFLVADVVFGPRIRETMGQFAATGLVEDAELPRFREGVRQSVKLVRSNLAEIVILGIVVAAVAFGLQKGFLIEVTSWQFERTGNAVALTAAGWWFIYVGIPVYQFLLLRWVWRFLIYDHFLWRVSKFNLQLIPSHADRAGGLGFLGVGQEKFGLFVLAIASVYACVLGEKILYGGASLSSFILNIAIFIGVILVAFLAPLLIFTPKLTAAKRKGLLQYGALTARHNKRFQKRWIGSDQTDQDPLGAPDMSSLADLGASYSVVEEMRVVPFGLNTVIFLVGPALVPMLPLLLTTFSPAEILEVLKGIAL
jgi:hypothetical protein